MKRILLLSVLSLTAFTTHLHAQGGVLPKTLIVPGSPEAAGQVSVKDDGQVTATPGADGIVVNIKPGDNPYPGLAIKPANGAATWDLGLYGHVEIQVTNTSDKVLDLNLRVDNDSSAGANAWNAEAKKIGPGQTKTLRTYFGYSYGFRPGFKLNPQAVTRLMIFTGKTADELNFTIKSVEGAGWTGEPVGADPDRVAIKPPGGKLLDPSTTVQQSQIAAKGTAKGSIGADGKSLQLDFTGGPGEAVTFRPAIGLWNLNEQLEVKVNVKNTGQTPVTPSVRIESEAGPSDTVAADAPIAPGAEGEITVPFAAKVPFKGVEDPKEQDPTAKGSFGAQPGTGTLYKSNNTSGVTILPDSTPGAKSLQVTSIVADLPPAPTLPDWLGTKPPVDGDWTQTLDEEFAGDSIDLHRWNVHCANWWDKRMHFSKDNVIVKDGTLILRMEKKTGYNNDDPTGATKYSGGQPTDYAAGQPDTTGKWSQRYGYFEVKEKQPTANSCWPGFWMMPDRGIAAGPMGKRGSTSDGGMEFDVTESQSSWGIHRFNIACHWDGYKETHKSLGTSANYVQADKDGYITVGLLWVPGSIKVFGNGKEIFSWDSPRISSQEEILILQNELGGWDNEPVNDAQLPADYTVKYIKVWQRKDLASPEDGPKPNKGDMDVFNETATTASTTPAPK